MRRPAALLSDAILSLLEGAITSTGVPSLASFHMLATSAGVGAAAGLVALLRSGDQLTFRAVVGFPAYAGAMGFIIAAYMMEKDGTVGNAYLILAMSAVQGLAGLRALDLMQSVAKKSGITLQFLKPKDEETP